MRTTCLSWLIIYLDFHKIYIDDESYHSGHGHAYEFYGVNSKNGATAIVRPDGCKSSDCPKSHCVASIC